MKVKINIRLALLLLTTNKQFLLYNLKDNKITEYRLTNDYILTGNNRKFTNFKVVSCIKNDLQTIKF